MIHLLIWLIVLQIIGLAGFVWAFHLFRDLPDRGYGVSKVFGLLLIAYAYWALVTARVIENGLLSLLIVIALLCGASAILFREHRAEMQEFARARWRLLAAHEIVFLLAIAAFAAFRVLAPDVTVSTSINGLTTEQPMDLAFLASSLNSETFPAADPWLSGHSISYYYFGYLAFSIPAQITGASAAVGYNLAFITLFGLTASAAFSLTTNAIIRADLVRIRMPRLDVAVVIGGLAAVVSLLVAGNFSGGLQGITESVSGGGLPDNSVWWWQSTRIIEDAGPFSPIDEIPAFSFVLGDLHPHVMSLPFVLLALSVSLAWLAKEEAPDSSWPMRRTGELFITALIIGALGFINTWDILMYFAVLALAITVRRLWEPPVAEGQNRRAFALDVVVPAGAIGALAVFLFMPYYIGIDGGVRGVLPVPDSGTGLDHYLRIWGPMALAIIPPLAYAWLRLKGKEIRVRVAAGILLLSATPLILWTVIAIAWGLLPSDSPVAESAPRLIDTGMRMLVVAPAVMLAAAGLVAAMPPRWGGTPERPGMIFAAILLVAAAMAIVVPELFFAWDSFGARMNTVFKVHYQAWLLLSVATGVGLTWLITRRPPRASLAQGAVIGGAVIGIGLMATGAAYGPLAAASRISSSPSASLSLDGLATYRTLYPDDAAAIDWLADNAESGSFILEAVGGDYSDHGRVSAITGMPTPIGWIGHELQWRGGSELFAGRAEAVADIYLAHDALEDRPLNVDEMRQLIEFYEIDYIFVGALEREAFGNDTAQRLLEAAPGRMEVAHESGNAAVLRFISTA